MTAKHYQNPVTLKNGGLLLYNRTDMKSPIWYARYRVAGRYKVQSLSTVDFGKAKVIAEDEYDELKFKEKHGMPVFERKFTTVVADFIEYQQKRVDLAEISKHAMSTTKSIMNSWLKYFGDVDLTKITTKKVEGYTAWRKENNRSGASIRLETLKTEISYFSQCMHWAKDNRWISDHQMPVIKNIKIRKHDVARRPAFTFEEYLLLIMKLRSWIAIVTTPEKDRWRWKTELYDKQMLYYYVLFLINTGIRTGSETIELEWRDIEYEDGHVFINWSSPEKVVRLYS